MNAGKLIDLLGLKPLPEEGGFFKEVYRAAGEIPHSALPSYTGKRRYCTSIYYLITPEDFSGLHRVKSDEIFHFYMGDPVKMVQINDQGELKEIILGSNLEKGEVLKIVVPAGIWQGTRLLNNNGWALMGCTVAPGFEFDDFEGASRADLSKLFPKHRTLIGQYTHK